MNFREKFFLSCLILVISLPANSWGTSAKELSKSVVFLKAYCQVCEDDLEGNKQEIWYREPYTGKYRRKINTISGTAFIIKHNSKDYLVTAKHIVDCLLKDVKILMNFSGGIMIISSKHIETSIPGTKWFLHPSEDVAIHPLFYPQKVNHISFPSKVCSKEVEEIPLLSKISIMGFPQGLGIQEIVSPIAKEVSVAKDLVTIGPPHFKQNHDFILLDQALCQGYSGAPVFFIEEIFSQKTEIIHLIGIQSCTISDITGGKISLVVPISNLWDILQSTDFLIYEQTLEKKL